MMEFGEDRKRYENLLSIPPSLKLLTKFDHKEHFQFEKQNRRCAPLFFWPVNPHYSTVVLVYKTERLRKTFTK